MSAWERALQGSGGGSLGSAVRSSRSRSVPEVTSASSAWERARRDGGGGSLGAFIRERTPSIPPTPRPAPEIPSVPDYIPGGDQDSRTTNPSLVLQPDPYPTVLPSLSAEQLGVLSERRRLADERLKQAQARSDRQRDLIEAAAERSRETAARESRVSLEDFMRKAAGKGVARNPMVAGRQVRRSGEDLRLKYGEIDTRLSTDIMALQDLVSNAELERDTELARIEQERVNMQADLERLFPAAYMYGA